jgi:cytochrome c peroxidase
MPPRARPDQRRRTTHRTRPRTHAAAALLILLGCSAAADETALVELGRRLFFDPNLSATRNQSCGSCHDPARAFTDSADNGVGGAASLGADGASLGDRNAPTLTYAAARPDFHALPDGSYAGGYFLDGRAASLELQAGMPLVDPREMALSGTAELAARLRENASYEQGLREAFGSQANASDSTLALAAQRAIAAYERSAEFFTYDSKYDRYLSGEYRLSPDEAIGRELFFSDLTNCRHCHLADPNRVGPREPFTNHRYHNVGTPVNARLRAANGSGPAVVDRGLSGNPMAAGDPGQDGRFRVPTLRNVAVTSPYMHNGVFARLETAVLFYGRHLTVASEASRNPETGRPWRPAEVPATVDQVLLRKGQPLDRQRAAQLTAFLRTLTDRRYEHLLSR